MEGSRLRLVDCVVRLTDLEAVVGLEFFPNLLGSYANGVDTGISLHKELADALTDDLRIHANKQKLLEDGKSHDENDTLPLLPGAFSEDACLSKRRQRKVKQVLRDNDPPLFQHLCKQNNACYKYHILSGHSE
jgi:hypothetical protein